MTSLVRYICAAHFSFKLFVTFIDSNCYVTFIDSTDSCEAAFSVYSTQIAVLRRCPSTRLR